MLKDGSLILLKQGWGTALEEIDPPTFLYLDIEDMVDNLDHFLTEADIIGFVSPFYVFPISK